MRSTIVLIAIILAPAFVVGHWWYFMEFTQPELLARTNRTLKSNGIKTPSVTMHLLHARIAGLAAGIEERERATSAVRQLPGLQLSPSDNLLLIPARIEFSLRNMTVELEGLLPNQDAVDALEKIVTERRPDLAANASRIRTSPFVILGMPQPDGTQPALTDAHKLLRPLLKAIRVPASLSIKREGDAYIARGHLPSEALRQGVLDALQANPAQWRIEAGELIVSRFIDKTEFTDEKTLPVFLQHFFSVPVPGEFSISEGQGPRLTGTATREMESLWLSSLRQVSGGAKVEADITLVPSDFHLPGRRPVSNIPPETVEPLLKALREAELVFDPGSPLLPPTEEIKIAAMMPSIIPAGVELKLLICGYDDPALAPAASKEMTRQRAEAVIAKLRELGMPAMDVEIRHFDMRKAHGTPSEQERSEMARHLDIIAK